MRFCQRSGLEYYDEFAAILAGEKQVQTVNRRFQTVQDMGAIFNLARHDTHPADLCRAEGVL